MNIRTFLPCISLVLAACQSSPAAPREARSPSNPSSPDDPTALEPSKVPTVPTTPQDLAASAKGDHELAAKLYAKLDAQPGNIFFSPTSIRMALAMTYAGARGDTAREMASALALDPDHDAVNRSFAAALQAYGQADTGDDKQTLRVVNRLWGQKGHALLPAYASGLSSYYGAPLQGLDFLRDPEGSRKTINDFIERETEHKIIELLPTGSVGETTKLVLTNAVYFKAAWSEPFNEASTQDADFFAPAGQTVRAKLMRESGTFMSGSTTDAQVLELPYASGKSSMVIVLPKNKDGLAQLEAQVNGGGVIDSWIAGLHSEYVRVTLPRFKSTSSMDLVATLRALGMSRAFTDDADFSGMDGARDLAISDVVHKAYVGVDEKGTEAAAATAVVMRPTAIAMPIRQPTEFRADHPFLFFVRDTRTGAVLFMGRVSDPTKS